MEIECLIAEICREHADFMSCLQDDQSPICRQMQTFVKKHLSELPSDAPGRLALADLLYDYRMRVLEDAMELVENRSMLRILCRYDGAVERLEWALRGE